MISYKVSEKDSGTTLEKYVRKKLNIAPLSFIYKLFRKKDVKVNGHCQDRKYIIKEDEVISLYVTDTQLAQFQKNKEIETIDNISSLIVYEDENILIINKPRGILVQKDRQETISLTEQVLSYLSFKGEYNPALNTFTPSPAHRIDRNTSGLVVFGKNNKTLQYLGKLFQEKDKIVKHYYALVKGNVKKDGTIEAPLFKDERNNRVFVSDDGKQALTKYHVVKNYKDFTLLEIIILTGRTHQIRVHMAYISHPIIGDSKYGDFSLNKEFEQKYNFRNQFLHAYRLDFNDVDTPIDNLKNKIVEIEMPREMKEILKCFE